MILQICGNIIDTQYIYNITEVEGYNEVVFFSIQFINRKSIEISKSYDRGNCWVGDRTYLERIKVINMQLNSIRDQLICKWKANQSVIPKIEFDEDNSIT